MKTETVKKILIALIVLVIAGACVGFGCFIAKNPASKTEEPSGNTSVQETEDEDDISYNESPTQSDAVSDDETQKSGTTVREHLQEDLQKSLLIGAWTDNANFSGYEFFENGTMKVTYFNMEVINLEDVIEGTYSGTYTVSEDRLTVSYTIYSRAITKNYTFKVDENTLILTEGAQEAIYVRKDASSVMENVDKNLLGKWSSNLSGFEFKDNGVVSITFIDLGSMGINIPVNGTVDGIYSINADELKIKYSIYTGVIEKSNKYKIEKDTLTLTEIGTNETGIYTRKN